MRARAACFLGGLLLFLAQADAFAASAPHEQPAERHLACLQRGAAPGLKPDAVSTSASALLRARLTFRPGSPEPEVELLWNRWPEAAAAAYASYLRGYRMPCLEAQPQSLVQEFWLEPGSAEPKPGEVWPMATPGEPGSCYAPPARGVAATEQWGVVLANFRFVPGQEGPEVLIVHQVGATAAVDAVRQHVAKYRRCSGERTTTGWHEQVFEFLPPGWQKPALPALELTRFLGMVRGIEQMRAHFDTGTMACPFNVDLSLYQPAGLNRARSSGDENPQRAALLAWLGSLRLNLPQAAETALFTKTMKISVPCLHLELTPDASKT